MSVQLKKGVLDLLVLHKIKEEDKYAYELSQEIDKLLNISESSVYGVVRRLQKESFITTYLKESSSGPARKYFSITPLGKEKYNLIHKEWKDFNRQINLILKEKNDD